MPRSANCVWNSATSRDRSLYDLIKGLDVFGTMIAVSAEVVEIAPVSVFLRAILVWKITESIGYNLGSDIKERLPHGEKE